MTYATASSEIWAAMPANLTLSAGTLYRVPAGTGACERRPGFRPATGSQRRRGPAKVAFAIGFTLALSAQWPTVEAQSVTASTLAAWAGAEAAIGVAIGVSVTIVLEAFTLSAQVMGLQAGYAFAQTIDPNTQADSGILLVLAQLLGGMFFFAMGLDRQILRLFALSLAKIPAGTWVFSRSSAESLIHLASSLFSVGIRLALPVVALLVMVDVALALMGRLNSQLQLLSLAFPAKMLLALLVLSWVAALFPRILRAVGRTLLVGARFGRWGYDRPCPTAPPRPSRPLPNASRRRARKDSFPPPGKWYRRSSSWFSWHCWDGGAHGGLRGSGQYTRPSGARIFRRICPEDLTHIARQLFGQLFLPLAAGRACGSRGNPVDSPGDHALRLESQETGARSRPSESAVQAAGIAAAESARTPAGRGPAAHFSVGCLCDRARQTGCLPVLFLWRAPRAASPSSRPP